VNLVPVPQDRYAAYFICLGCGKRMVLSRAEPTFYADLDGEPFRAYYCGPCAERVNTTKGDDDERTEN
jgi:uncharacterized protein YlaI